MIKPHGTEKPVSRPRDLFLGALALSLLVLWVFTDDHHVAFALDHLALLTDFFHRRTYFHNGALLL